MGAASWWWAWILKRQCSFSKRSRSLGNELDGQPEFRARDCTCAPECDECRRIPEREYGFGQNAGESGTRQLQRNQSRGQPRDDSQLDIEFAAFLFSLAK